MACRVLSQSPRGGQEHSPATLEGGWQGLTGRDLRTSVRGRTDQAATGAPGSAKKPWERGSDSTHCNHQHIQEHDGMGRHAHRPGPLCSASLRGHPWCPGLEPGVRPRTCQRLDHPLEDHNTLKGAHQPLEAVRDPPGDPSWPLADTVLCLRPSRLAFLTLGPGFHWNRAWEKPFCCSRLC